MIISSGIRPDLNAELEAIFDSDERAIWKGCSDGAIIWTPNAVLSVFMGVSLCFISLFWLVGSLPFLFELIGYYLLAIGAYRIIYPTYWSAYRRKRSLYILTDRRAIIMVNSPILGNYTNSYPIDESTYIEFDSKDPGSIYFSFHFPNKAPMGYQNSEGSRNSILSPQVFGGYDPAYRTGLAVRLQYSGRIIQWFCYLLLLPLKINLSAIKIGFERIPHAAQVYSLMRSTQRGKA